VMKGIIIAAIIVCVNARTPHASQLTNFLRNANGFYDESRRDGHVPRFGLQKSQQLAQQTFPEEEPYPAEEGQAPPEGPYVPEEEPLLPDEQPSLPEQPFAGGTRELVRY
jgi:hypothetical protein